MRLLLDTHVFLWWIADRPLDPRAAAAITDPTTDVYVSAASIWEAEVKAAKGKLTFDADLLEEVRVNVFRDLPITAQHMLAAARLPMHHGDPWDRMLIAQAQLEGLTLVTRDPVFERYQVSLLAA